MKFDPETMHFGRPCWRGHIGIRYNNNNSCVQCMAENHKDYVTRNREKMLERHKQYFQENKERLSAMNTEWRKNHPEESRAIKRRWDKNNPEINACIGALRRAAQLQRTPKWADLEKIKQFYLNCPMGMTVDHIIPLQGKLVSGLHVHNNLQYLSLEENSRKQNKFKIE